MKPSTGGTSGKKERLSLQESSKSGIDDSAADESEDTKNDSAEDETTDSFFRSDIDYLLATPGERQPEQGSSSEEGFGTAEDGRRTSDIPVDIDDIIQETDTALNRIEKTQEGTQRTAGGGKSGIKAPSSSDPQKPASARSTSQQKGTGKSAATSAMPPTGKKQSQAKNETSTENNQEEAKASSYFRPAPVAASSAAARRPRPPAELAGNPDGRLPAGCSVNQGREGDESSSSTGSDDSDTAYASFRAHSQPRSHRDSQGGRRNYERARQRGTERQGRAGPFSAPAYWDITVPLRNEAPASAQGAGYPQAPAYPQASAPAQATAYRQPPPPLARAPPQASVFTQAPAYPQPRGDTGNPVRQPSNYAPNPEFQRYSTGPTGRVAFAGVAPPVSSWNANLQLSMPAPVAAPPRLRDWRQWQPGPIEPSPPRYSPPRYSLPRYSPPPPFPLPVFSVSSYGSWPGAGWDDNTCRCRSCCGECCQQAAAIRREQRWMESVTRWSPAPPLWRPQPYHSFGAPAYGGGLLPSRSTPWLWPMADGAAVAEPYWLPTRQFAWSTHRLPRHVWSTGGSFLSRSRSCPPPGYDYIDRPFRAGSSISLSTTGVPSAVERRYLPSGEVVERRYPSMPEDGERPRSSASAGMASAQSAVTFGVSAEPSVRRDTAPKSSLCQIISSISSCCAEPDETPPVQSEMQRARSISQQEVQAAYELSRPAGMPGKGTVTGEMSIEFGFSDGRPTISAGRVCRPLSSSGTISLASASGLLGSSSSSSLSSDRTSLMSYSDGLLRPASMEGVQAVVIPEASSTHGWYQPLHIVSHTSESYSQEPQVPVVLDPAEQELMYGAGGGMTGFATSSFNVTWDTPEEGAWRSFGSAGPYGGGAGSESDADRFSLSSDEMRRRREEAETGTHTEGGSIVPAAMETNMLRSTVSDTDLLAQQTEALGSEALQVEEGAEIGETEERGEFRDFEEGEFVDMVPVVVSEGEVPVHLEESPTSSEGETPQPFAAATQVNPETGVVEAVADTSPPLADEEKLQADKEAERMEQEIRDLELTSVVLYPESRLIILLALLCIIWILFLILSAAVRHGAIPGCETSTSTGGGSDKHTTETSAGDESRTRPTGKWPPRRPSGSTEEPLRGVYVCSTEYCKKEGDYLRSLTSHSSKRACEDFYEYVCEDWKKAATPLRGNQPGAAVSTDTLLQKAMEDRLLAYIKDATHVDVAPARTMYDRCSNRAEVDAALLDAKELFRSWGSDWPRANSSGGTPDDVWRFAAKLLRFLGVPSLLGVEVGIEPRDLDKTIVEVGPPKGTIFFAKDVSEPRVMALFTEAAWSAAQSLKPQDADAANAASRDVSIALATLSLLNLDDLGTSPLDFEVESFGTLGRGVQAFMRVVFENVAVFSANTRIMVHRSRLVLRKIDDIVGRASPRALLNYLGLLALVSLSPFLPERFGQLRVLHSVHALGRAEAPTTEQLCIRAAVQAYPACAVKASREVHKDVRRSLWLSQLEALFVDRVRDVSWVDNLTSLFVRYKMRHHRFERFFPARTLDECKQVATRGRPKAMGAFVEAVSLRQTQLLAQYGKNLHPVGPGSPLSVWARYRLCLQLLQIPVGLVNSSVPTNGTFFALHLSRFAVRLYAGLAQMLYEGTVYELELPLYFTEDAERAFDEALDCLLYDARRRFPYGLDADRVRNALLEQVLALQLGFLAFRQLLGVRRIWYYDFQLSTLPGVTADQLFFLYYALDNCELSDKVFESHQFEAHRRLPASMRVNMALRQSMRFAHAYGCAANSPMAAGVPCHLLR
ncbi:uncharacterized protein [Dermacentor albipictus]|uniref:uncharacterized protein isoform X2 n=1 Tax=Dermacentor albipictus TaxID=60249 RepID=UPI0038FC76C5